MRCAVLRGLKGSNNAPMTRSSRGNSYEHNHKPSTCSVHHKIEGKVILLPLGFNVLAEINVGLTIKDQSRNLLKMKRTISRKSLHKFGKVEKDKSAIPFEYWSAYDHPPNRKHGPLYLDVTSCQHEKGAYSLTILHASHFQMGKASSRAYRASLGGIPVRLHLPLLSSEASFSYDKCRGLPSDI